MKYRDVLLALASLVTRMVILAAFVWVFHLNIPALIVASILLGVGWALVPRLWKRFRTSRVIPAPGNAREPPLDIEALRKTVLSRLYAVAKRRGILVKLVNPSEMPGVAGRYIIDTRKAVLEIELRRDHVHYLLLAHELGHHIAIARRDDHSELAADEEGYRLILSVLTDEETKWLKPVIDSLKLFSKTLHAKKTCDKMLDN